MLLEGIVLSVEGKQEFLNLCSLGREADIEGMVGFRSNSVVEVSHEVVAIVLNHIKPCSCCNRALILKDYLHDSFLANPGLSELENWGPISF